MLTDPYLEYHFRKSQTQLTIPPNNQTINNCFILFITLLEYLWNS